jgi:hypothetical protein
LGGTAVHGPKGQGSPPASTTIFDVANEYGISVARLRSIELAAIQAACRALVRDGQLSAQQCRTRLAAISSWPQSNLDGYSMYAFQPHQS